MPTLIKTVSAAVLAGMALVVVTPQPLIYAAQLMDRGAATQSPARTTHQGEAVTRAPSQQGAVRIGAALSGVHP